MHTVDFFSQSSENLSTKNWCRYGNWLPQTSLLQAPLVLAAVPCQHFRIQNLRCSNFECGYKIKMFDVNFHSGDCLSKLRVIDVCCRKNLFPQHTPHVEFVFPNLQSVRGFGSVSVRFRFGFGSVSVRFRCFSSVSVRFRFKSGTETELKRN